MSPDKQGTARVEPNPSRELAEAWVFGVELGPSTKPNANAECCQRLRAIIGRVSWPEMVESQRRRAVAQLESVGELEAIDGDALRALRRDMIDLLSSVESQLDLRQRVFLAGFRARNRMSDAWASLAVSPQSSWETAAELLEDSYDYSASCIDELFQLLERSGGNLRLQSHLIARWPQLPADRRNKWTWRAGIQPGPAVDTVAQLLREPTTSESDALRLIAGVHDNMSRDKRPSVFGTFVEGAGVAHSARRFQSVRDLLARYRQETD